MTTTTKIEWTEQTWNATTGCTKISPGCKHCYAETMAKRLRAMGTPGYENGFALTLMPERLDEPLRRRKPTMYFVNSMSDVFHQKVPFSYVDRIFETIEKTPQHTYQVLTKRADRMADYFASRTAPTNAWLGVSVENRRYGLPRIDLLRDIKATVRFLSIEPLLEGLGPINLAGIHWVIVGGESGPKARPMKLEWLDDVSRQRRDARVAFFFKQWGVWGADGERRSKRSNGREFQGRTWDEMPVHAVA
ncbi:MAG TPA: phage Gp37/Gp68 family protein [Nevskia sp.]|nr:phage Gp37/Gp68 family protein [Nevskia sp.]